MLLKLIFLSSTFIKPLVLRIWEICIIFSGVEVTYLPNGISLSQRKFTQDLLLDTSLVTPRSAATPLPLQCKLTPKEGNLFLTVELLLASSIF